MLGRSGKKARQMSILRQPLRFFPWERASVGHLGLHSLRSAQLLTLLFDVICHVLGSLTAVLAGQPASLKLPLEICQLFLLADSPSAAQAACVWLRIRNQVFNAVVRSQVSRSGNRPEILFIDSLDFLGNSKHEHSGVSGNVCPGAETQCPAQGPPYLSARRGYREKTCCPRHDCNHKGLILDTPVTSSCSIWRSSLATESYLSSFWMCKWCHFLRE